MQRVTITSTRYYTRYRTFSLSLTWKAIMERITITSVRYYMHFHTFSFSLAWFGDYL